MNQAINIKEPHSHTIETDPESRKHVLLVEDDRVAQEILSRYLLNAGYTIDTAENGQHAWQLLQTKKDYHLIVTDRIMPEMNGMELFTLLKNDSVLRHIPVIMQTGADQPEEISEGIEAGVYYYLTKPYQEQALLALVRSAIISYDYHLFFSNLRDQQHEALDHLERGTFHLRSIEQAQNIAFLLGSAFPRPELSVMGLYELLVNSVEHGLLEIGFDTKSRLLASGNWEKEIRQRLSVLSKEKHVAVEFIKTPQHLEITITDPGPGFEWQNYLEIEPARATKANGRGIAKANLLGFDKVNFIGNGNSVKLFSNRR